MATRWDELNGKIIACELCPRLINHCRLTAEQKRRAYADFDYWGRPVPNFGDPRAKLLIVGLAPGAHGANRTGRMFTGDRSGDWLFRALHQAGFANQPTSTTEGDGLRLKGCAITAACHCAPPANKPTPEEIANCRHWYEETVRLLQPRVYLALGQIGWTMVLRHAADRGWYTGKRPRFGHDVRFQLGPRRWLVGSYHPSQQNTFTGRLTQSMFRRVFVTAQELLES